MKKTIAILTLTVLGFGVGTIFQRQIGVGTVLVSLGIIQAVGAIDTFAPRIASLDALAIPDKGIVFIGDSLIELQEWSEAFTVSGIINRGISGAKIRDITGKYDLSKAKAIFCLIGINDLGHGANLQEFKTRYQAFVDSIPENVDFFAISIPSIINYPEWKVDTLLIEQCNAYIREATARRAGFYIDIFQASKQGGAAFHVADGVHFSKEGYVKIIAILKPYVEKGRPNPEKGVAQVLPRASG